MTRLIDLIVENHFFFDKFNCWEFNCWDLYIGQTYHYF